MARLSVCLCAVLLAAGPASADDAPKPNALTPKEVADGWLLLFDGQTTFGWKTEGDVSVKDGELVLGKGKKSSAYLTTRFGNNADLSFDVMGNARIGVGLLQGTAAIINPEAPGQWASHRINRDGAKIQLSGSDQSLRMGTSERPAGSESALLVVVNPGGDEVRVRNVKLRPLGTAPLFNGKDLSGWKVFAGEKYKSKFEVTPAGELRVTNGPGDLQTEKAFDNFVLQLECKTNGKALNSGVFFRCLPDQYQNGYEMQIQNAYKDNDRTKPADFGTGAIYRRVPARKVVSNDNEWFTLTLVADGTHIATWVNGVQVVDWTDDRPADENPRKGSKTGKGHLSIQGHDPTTDLLFRNIRINELPAKK